MYLGYYLVGGIVATLCHWFAASDGPNSLIPVVGASGAVAAVLGGYALTFPTAKVRTLVFFFLILIVDLPALLLLGIWFALQVASGVLGQMAMDIVAQPVAFWAHVGGFVTGMVLMPLLSLGAPPPGTDWRKESDELFRFDDPRWREIDKETGRQGDKENR
jgi:membrane associated rhomboid family serine protease